MADEQVHWSNERIERFRTILAGHPSTSLLPDARLYAMAHKAQSNANMLWGV
jgi:hypothetical protein